ncbi:hypothetical protein MKX67_18405 [Cytobacillus sp. FSL W7-1323]|nr:hypothetical protein [Cytobacillus kochii]MCM3324253.1 hypothetical protein [Cytobacillus kochii]MCM3346678.1 hypothetical protein [Cytobacillus kochii]MDQ0186339.1 formylmethanofuran dehydrogenase subunit E [Cytobacillus kochii]MED1607767.1 hypothetical protein [Cytobacillus kochii]
MEQVKQGLWICSKCEAVITDYNEYHDNDGVCDVCYSIPIKKRRGLLK